MTTNVELYEALKPTVGQDAARMISEIFPPTRELATKADVEALGFATREQFASVRGETREAFASVRGEMREEFAKLRGEMGELRGELHSEITRNIRWTIGVMLPLFAATWGTVAALFLKS